MPVVKEGRKSEANQMLNEGTYMRAQLIRIGIVLAVTIFAPFTPSALAVEGGMQRPFPGCRSRRLPV